MPLDHPGLSAEVVESIQVAQFSVHKHYHLILVALQYPPYSDPMTVLQMMARDPFTIKDIPPGPIPPKRPLYLFSLLRQYAGELFGTEIAHHHLDLMPPSWIEALARHIQDLVMRRVGEIGGLKHHATVKEMQDAINEETSRKIGILLAPTSPVVPLLPDRLPSVKAVHPPIPGTPSPMRGYRVPIRAWMHDHTITSVRVAARRLGVSESVLKSIMTTKGKIRHSSETLDKILKAIGHQSGDQS